MNTPDHKGPPGPSTYNKLAAVNVNEHVKKKGQLAYLSWPWAVDQLLRVAPLANWEYGEPTTLADGTMLVYCTVTVDGVARRMHLPVMDNRSKAIANPDAFQINTAMQRCLVKAIALHGLGLYIYADEDLPVGEDRPPLTEIEEQQLQSLRDASLNGMVPLETAWKALTPEMRKRLSPDLPSLKQAAAAVQNAT